MFTFPLDTQTYFSGKLFTATHLQPKNVYLNLKQTN